jgi:hypothetical protein
MRIGRLAAVAVLVGGLAAGGCSGASKTSPPGAAGSATPSGSAATGGSTAPGAPSASAQAPLPPEDNPPGDIPDNQAFVTYGSDSGSFQVRVPEGWGRTDGTGTVTFTDHLNTVQVNWRPAAAPPSVDRANAQDVPELQRTRLAFNLKKVSTATMPGGAAVLIQSQENSEPNVVTSKQYRLDVLRFLFSRNGQEAVLMLSSPAGADNVDPWKVVSESFRWR